MTAPKDVSWADIEWFSYTTCVPYGEYRAMRYLQIDVDIARSRLPDGKHLDWRDDYPEPYIYDQAFSNGFDSNWEIVFPVSGSFSRCPNCRPALVQEMATHHLVFPEGVLPLYNSHNCYPVHDSQMPKGTVECITGDEDVTPPKNQERYD